MAGGCMRSILRVSVLFAALLFVTAPSFAQGTYGDRGSGVMSGTVVDIEKNRLHIEPDSDTSMQMTIEADAVSTVYYGFGTVIGGKPEIFTGTSGFSNIRVGDRVEVRGASVGNDVFHAQQV